MHLQRPRTVTPLSALNRGPPARFLPASEGTSPAPRDLPWPLPGRVLAAAHRVFPTRSGLAANLPSPSVQPDVPCKCPQTPGTRSRSAWPTLPPAGRVRLILRPGLPGFPDPKDPPVMSLPETTARGLVLKGTRPSAPPVGMWDLAPGVRSARRGPGPSRLAHQALPVARRAGSGPWRCPPGPGSRCPLGTDPELSLSLAWKGGCAHRHQTRGPSDRETRWSPV